MMVRYTSATCLRVQCEVHYAGELNNTAADRSSSCFRPQSSRVTRYDVQTLSSHSALASVAHVLAYTLATGQNVARSL
jgi:hypothetical protein